MGYPVYQVKLLLNINGLNKYFTEHWFGKNKSIINDLSSISHTRYCKLASHV